MNIPALGNIAMNKKCYNIFCIKRYRPICRDLNVTEALVAEFLSEGFFFVATQDEDICGE